MTQLALSFSEGDIVACDGMWEDPGLDAAQAELCNVEAGFHICGSVAEVKKLGLSDDDCGSQPAANTFAANTFYLTRVTTRNRIFGCGNVTDNVLPVSTTREKSRQRPLSLSLYERTMKKGLHTNGPWRLDEELFFTDVTEMDNSGNNQNEHIRDTIYKSDIYGGGALCCRKSKWKKPKIPKYGDDETVPIGVVGAPLIIEVLIWLLLLFVIGMSCWEMTKAIIASAAQRIPWCQRLHEWDGVLRICGRKIPISRSARVKFKHLKQIAELECRKFSSFQDPGKHDSDRDLISDGSGACIICWEPYEAKSKVLRLKCGHRMYLHLYSLMMMMLMAECCDYSLDFHKECAAQWLVTHKQCPVCRQDFRVAQNQFKQQDILREIEDIEMEEMEELKVDDDHDGELDRLNEEQSEQEDEELSAHIDVRELHFHRTDEIVE